MTEQATEHVARLLALAHRTCAEYWQAPSRETLEAHRRAVAAYEAAAGRAYSAAEHAGAPTH